MKKTLWRLILGAAVYAAALVIKSNIIWLSPLLFGISFLCIGGDIVFKALRNISHGRVFDENFLMSIATIGAFIIGEYPEGVAVMLFIRWESCSRVMQLTNQESPLQSLWISARIMPM